MPEESATPDLVERAHALRDAANSHDLDALIGFYAPDATTDATRTLGITLQGRETIRSFLREWLGAYEELEWEPEEIRDLGKGVLFAVVRQDARPTGTTGHVQQREALVYRWVAGLIVAITVYPYSDIDEARAAAERLAQESAGG